MADRCVSRRASVDVAPSIAPYLRTACSRSAALPNTVVICSTVPAFLLGEGDGDVEGAGFVVVAPAVRVDQLFGADDFPVDDFVVVIDAVWSVHDVASNAARLDVDFLHSRGEACRSPPLRQMFGIGPCPEDELRGAVKVRVTRRMRPSAAAMTLLAGELFTCDAS